MKVIRERENSVILQSYKPFCFCYWLKQEKKKPKTQEVIFLPKLNKIGKEDSYIE